MNIISQVTSAMQQVLTQVANTAAVATGFIKRRRKISGAAFVQTLVFGWLANPESTYDELAQTAGTIGISITRQALEQRFGKPAAEMLKQTLDASVEQALATQPQVIPLLSRFNGVFIQDSSWITLPDELADVWPGCGTDADFGGQASIKLQFRWELLSGAFEHLSLTDGKTHDCKAQKEFNPLAAGSLRLADLGYFSLTALKEMNHGKVLWLTRFKANCQLFDITDALLNLPTWQKSTHHRRRRLSDSVGQARKVTGSAVGKTRLDPSSQQATSAAEKARQKQGENAF